MAICSLVFDIFSFIISCLSLWTIIKIAKTTDQWNKNNAAEEHKRLDRLTNIISGKTIYVKETNWSVQARKKDKL